MIYLDDHIWDFDLQEALASVSPQRREQVLRYRQELDQRLSVAAYCLLQRALLHEYSITEAPQFTFNTVGKPQLEGYPHIHFSLSHCQSAVACAVDSQPVGIDIETIDNYNEELAARVMNDAEMHQIKTSLNPAIVFTRLWTMKESLYKLTGNDRNGDIRHMLDDISHIHFTTINYPQFTLTTAQNKRP